MALKDTSHDFCKGFPSVLSCIGQDFFFFETRSYVYQAALNSFDTKDDLELLVLLPQASGFWDYGHGLFDTEARASSMPNKHSTKPGKAFFKC